MHPKSYSRPLVWGFVALVATLGGALFAQQAQAQPPQPVDRSGTVIVPVGGAVRLQMKNKKLIKQVFNEKPNIVLVEADAANPAYVILRGVQQGTSRIELTDVDNGKEAYEVVVQTDLDLLRSVLRRAVPTANVDVIPFGRGIVLTGTVALATDADNVFRIAQVALGQAGGAQGGGAMQNNIINALTVGGVHQVQLDVTVARVDRTKSRQRGVNFAVNGSTFSTGSIIGGLATSNGSTGNSTVSNGVGIIPGAASLLPTSATNLVFGIVPAQFQGLLQALKTEGLAKLIAEPKLVTQSGKSAHFLSGGQQATLSAASGVNGPGVQYIDIGTELDFLPIVYGNGKIYLEVLPSVKSVNTALGVTTTFGTVPGFDQQAVRTAVVMESGQTFAIGGLIQTTVQASAARVPVLGELPLLSSIFSVVSYSEEEQELVILVTPHLVDPMDCNQVPKRMPGAETRSPDDYEFYLDSMLELPRGQRRLFEAHHYKGAWKNDPTAASFPCNLGGPGGANCNTCTTPNGRPFPASPLVPNAQPQPNQLPPALAVPMEIPVPPKEQR